MPFSIYMLIAARTHPGLVVELHEFVVSLSREHFEHGRKKTLEMNIANSSPQSMGKFMKPQPKCDEMSFERNCK
jgi:hypothetical protein